MDKVFINDYEIDAMNIKMEVTDRRKQLSIDFKVTYATYHDVTTLLYRNDFVVRVPSKNMEFHATIKNYSTSITNLYEEGNVGDYKLVLIEK